jgi:hypothetical protein
MSDAELQGWLLTPAGPVHRRGTGDWARCRAVLLGAVACSLLACEVYGVPKCPLCFPATASPYARSAR